jgi:hypothetical protein
VVVVDDDKEFDELTLARVADSFNDSFLKKINFLLILDEHYEKRILSKIETKARYSGLLILSHPHPVNVTYQ